MSELWQVLAWQTLIFSSVKVPAVTTLKMKIRKKSIWLYNVNSIIDKKTNCKAMLLHC